jgi:hypothetical protein
MKIKHRRTYEVNADSNRSYRSYDARSVARVAAAWLAQGHEPHAYAVLDGEAGTAVKVVAVPVTRVMATAEALRRAS